jgi:hypothetical protein
MATYKGIQGYSVQKLSSDPTASEAAGQLWYNSSTGAYKISVGSAGAWASGADINTARSQEGAAGISNSSALIFGGAVPSATDVTEEYNGTAWSEKGDLNNARTELVGLGTQTAALAVGGSPPSTAGYTESWNGTSWTSKNVLSRGSASPAASAYAAGAGSTTSALFFGGDEGPNTTALCEQFDGTNWTEVGNLTTARSYMVGAGTSNASVITFGGYPGPLDVTEEWNGSSWTEVADLNTARQRDMAACQGTTTASLCFGGDASPDHLTVTEKWDGTSWTEVADLATGVNDSGGAGVQSSAISAGGVNAPSPVGVVGTEEWTDPVYTIKTVTVS